MELTVSTLKELVDMETVVDLLDIPVKYVGKRIQILCPCHNDHNFGSCYIDSKGFHCYSCGAGGDVIELVKAALKCSFAEACNFLAESLNSSMKWEDDFGTTRVLDRNSLQIIGLSACSTPVYETVEIVNDVELYYILSDKDNLRKNGLVTEWYPYSKEYIETNPNGVIGYGVLKKLIAKNPLIELKNNDIEGYNELIRAKAIEAKKEYQKYLKFVLSPDFDDIEKRLLYAQENEINNLLQFQEMGFSELIKHLERLIQKCEEIAIDHSTSQPVAYNKTQKTSIFGKIKGGISL